MSTTRARLEPPPTEANAGDLRLAPKGLEISPVSVQAVARPLTAADESIFVALALESHEFHRKWIKLPTESAEFKSYLSKFNDEDAYFFVISDACSNSIVGFVSLTGIEGEPYRRGRLGYGVFERYARMGYISSGLRQVVDFAFENLKLHRLEADIQPDNSPSRRLVKKMGFTREGISRGFIRINDEWVDHERWALTPND